MSGSGPALLLPPTLSPARRGYNLRRISGLVCWLDAEDILKQMASGTTVQTWRDKSGLGNHAVQNTATNRPTVLANIRNAKAVIRFDGVDNWMDLPAGGTVLGNVTAIIVARGRTDATSRHILSSTASPAGFRIQVSTSNLAFLVGSTTVVAATQNTYKVITLRHGVSGGGGSGTAIEAFVNGTLVASGTDASTSALDLNLGSFSDGTSSFFNGDIAAVVLFNRSLTEAERLYVERALTDSYMNLYLPDEIEQDQPIGWWRLNDTVPGGVALDQGSLANNGTYNGSPRRISGIVAYVRDFGTHLHDPSVERITIPHQAAYRDPPFTLELSGRLDRLPTVEGHVFAGLIKEGLGGDPVPNTPSFSFSVGSGSGNEDRPFLTAFQSPSGLKTGAPPPPSALAIGQTYHAIGTVIAGNGPIIELFVDGISTGTAQLPAGQTLHASTGQLSIGGISGEQFYGVVQHAAIYNSQLSAARILAHGKAAIRGIP